MHNNVQIFVIYNAIMFRISYGRINTTVDEKIM